MSTAATDPWRKEFIELARDGRGWGLLLVLGGLLLLSAGIGVWQQHAAVQADQQATEAERARWLAQGERWAHAAAHYGIWAFRSPPPLAVADPGVGAYVGNAIWLEAHYQNAPLHRPAQDATPVERFGALSPAMVLGVLAPLALILLGYGAVAGERERGTWPLALAQGGSALRMLRAKWLALLAWIGLAAVPGLLLAAAGAWLVGSDGQTLPRLLLWLLAHAVYLAAIAALVVAVSALARSSLAALGLLLLSWVLALLWLPRMAPELAESWHPLPDQHRFETAVWAALVDAEGVDSAEEVQQRLMREHGVDTLEELPVNWTGINLQESEERGNLVFDELWGDLFGGIRQQQAALRWTGLISPWMALQPLSQALAGSDFAHHRAFLDQAEDARREIQRLLNEDLAEHPEHDGHRHLSGPEVWARVEPFAYRPPPLPRVLVEALPSVILLLLWAVAAWVLLGVAARRAGAGEDER